LLLFVRSRPRPSHRGDDFASLRAASRRRGGSGL